MLSGKRSKKTHSGCSGIADRPCLDDASLFWPWTRGTRMPGAPSRGTLTTHRKDEGMSKGAEDVLLEPHPKWGLDKYEDGQQLSLGDNQIPQSN